MTLSLHIDHFEVTSQTSNVSHIAGGAYRPNFRLSSEDCRKMPSFCSVVRCGNRAERDIVRFFKIPKALKNREEQLNTLSKERRLKWVAALKRGDLSKTFLNNAQICANHSQVSIIIVICQ